MIRTAVLLLLMALASAQDYPVQGVVFDQKTNQPLPHVRVSLKLAQNELASLWTSIDGRFSFSMPAGKYSLNAEYKGSMRLFGAGAGTGYGVAVVVGPGQDTSNLKFPWIAGAILSGTVRDEEGDPVEGAQIQVIRADISGGRRRNYSSAFIYTNDLGQYRLPGVPSGNYYLIATGQPWYSRNIEDKSPLKQSYAPAYYPNALHLRGAEPLKLESGVDAKADFTLSKVGSVTVTINCPDMKDQSGVIYLMADGPEGVHSFQVTSGMYGEHHSLKAVPSGRYVLRVTRSGRNPARVLKPIEVGTSDLTLDLSLNAPVEITGKLAFKGDGPRSADAGVIFIDEANQPISTKVTADGSFTARNFYPGKYRISVWDSRALPIEEIVTEGATFKDGFLDVGIEPVKLSLTVIRTQISELKGFVKTGAAPTPGAAVILAPKEWTSDPAAFRSFQTDSDGSFHFNDVSVGEYILFALDRFDLEYTNQEMARPYLAAGRLVKITAGTITSETISLTK